MAGKRRGNGEGTIRQRPDGRWEARISLDSGKQRSVYGKTRAEVARKLAATTRYRDRGLLLALDERQTVGQFLTSWLETIRTAVKPRTWQRYEVAIRLHLTPALGKVKLSRLSPQQVQALYAQQLADGLAPATVAHLHSTLHGALDAALKLDLVARNVTELVTHPRPAHTEMHVLLPEQANQLLAGVEGDRLEALYVLALMTGMREGELLALRWADVDLDASGLHVRHTLHFDKGGAWRLGTPKTAKSRRRVQLPPTAVEALRAHRRRQLEERLAVGPAWADLDFVFTRPSGEPIRGTHLLERHFLPLLERMELPKIRFHDLRHTAATLLLLQNVQAKVVSELLGHSNVSITLDRYSHILPAMQESAAAAMERMLGARARLGAALSPDHAGASAN